MRPFFSYYGGKWRDTPRLYPVPTHRVLVEPFAGSAGYATRYPDRSVLLVDSDPVIVGVWRYLIGVRSSEILSLPDVVDHVDEIPLPDARALVGFWLNRAVSSPRKRPSSWMRSGVSPSSFWGPRVRATIASQVDRIRHWRVLHGTYADAPDVVASWFVDPPYQNAGRHYIHGSAALDFAALGAWCRRRQGQVIVCEQAGAKWLPFSALDETKTARASRSAEVAWVRDSEPSDPDGDTDPDA